MSVNYSLDAATASGLLLFHKKIKEYTFPAFAIFIILFRLKGSLWKLIWREMLGWTVLIVFLYMVYVNLLKGSEYEPYYKLLIDMTKDVPTDGTLTFLLSYMTYNSLTRWQDTFKCLAWPENVAFLYKQYCNKKAMTEHEAKCLNRSVARYLTVFYILLFRDVSSDVRDLFPTFKDLVQPGILTADEVNLLKSSRLNANSPHYWVPIDWIVVLIRSRYKSGRHAKDSIMTEVQYKTFITEINKLRGRTGDVLSYDWVPLPLALFQSLTIFVYSTLIVNCFQMQGRIITSGKSGFSELFVESMSTLPFSMLYLSFQRISQVIINPFGQDDDDFEVQYLIDRHIKVLNEILCSDDNETISTSESGKR
uniref:Bestrophin homolog n=1 Tax=Caenorhabditis japonica TaxID=281687 RepID=A0A8R1HR69_CAEJA